MAVQGEEGLSPPDPSFQVLEQDERGLIVEESPLNRSLKEDVDGVGSGSAYQIGDLVNVAKYGYGVVKWLGEVGGEAIAGIELVCNHNNMYWQPLLYIICYRRMVEMVVGMDTFQELIMRDNISLVMMAMVYIHLSIH